MQSELGPNEVVWPAPLPPVAEGAVCSLMVMRDGVDDGGVALVGQPGDRNPLWSWMDAAAAYEFAWN